jgi:hypothetical protein
MSTLWGIGTKLYGKSDRKIHPTYGETYITTEWFCLLYLPIIPLVSMRIGGVQEKSLILIVYNSTTTNYLILEKLPLYWPQIRRTFMLAWGSIILIFLYLRVSRKA